jgi:non-specific serine/threonine protein kinase
MDTDESIHFGDLLRRYRLAAGLTQEELAERAGVSARGIAALETGERRTPRKETIRLLADALALSAQDQMAFDRTARAQRPLPGQRSIQTLQSTPLLSHERALTPAPLDGQPTFAGSTLATGAATAPAPAGTPPSNLPIPLTRFIGREREIADVMRFLATTRLLTLIGPGGVGKTRLALEVAANVLPRCPDGVVLVELAGLSDPALVPQAVATALRVREAAGIALLKTMVAALKPRQLLLVLDNCEHLVAACAQLAETVLRACPDVRILVTSREPLHIPGEVIWHVPSLPSLDIRQLPGLDDLLRCDAIQLFVDRAQAVVPSFELTAEHAQTIARICTRLDGMPLAIELAAACVPMLSVQQLAARLDDRFRLLTGGSRTALERQQTLRATLDWSYHLLAAREQALFHRLAVFAGSFTLEAAEVICAGEGLDSSDILGLLTRLVDTSLVMVQAAHPGRRYRLLETIRQYCFEQTQATHELAARREQHLHWYLGLAQQAAGELHGPQQAHWMQLLELERDNLRAALEWGLTQPDSDAGLRLASAMCWFWYLNSSLSEGRSWFERALARTQATQRTWARAAALAGTGAMALYQGDFATAHTHLEKSITLWRELENRRGLAQALFGLGLVAVNQGDERVASAALEESGAIFHALGQTWPYAMTLMHLGDVALARGDWTTARTRYEACLMLQRAIGDNWGIAQILNNLGETARFAGDYAHAARHYEESLALFRELGTTGDVARVIHNLGYVARAQGDRARAEALFVESLKLFQERGSRRGVAECLAGLAGLLGQPGQQVSEAWRAARLLGAVQAQFESIGAAVWPADRREHARTMETLRAFLGQEALAAALAEGRGLTSEEAITEALVDTV